MHAVDRGVSSAEGDRGGGEALFALGEAGRGAARFGATLAGKVFQLTTGMMGWDKPSVIELRHQHLCLSYNRTARKEDLRLLSRGF